MPRSRNLRLRSIKESTQRKKLFGGSGFITMPHTDSDRFDNVLYKNYLKSGNDKVPAGPVVVCKIDEESKTVSTNNYSPLESIEPNGENVKIDNIISSEDHQTVSKKRKKRKPIVEEVVDFSFLLEEPEEIEEDKEFRDALNEMASKADLMAEFESAICVPIVADFIIKAIKQKLTEYPDTMENANNPDRQAFVNVFNILKRIIRKES